MSEANIQSVISCGARHGKDTRCLKSVDWHEEEGGKLCRFPRNPVMCVHNVEEMRMM